MSTIKRAVLKLATGAGLSQVILIAATPVLTRLFAPAQFGELAVFTSVFTILLAVATLRFEQAIVVPGSRDEGIRLAHIALLAALVAGAACLAVLFVARGAGVALDPFHYAMAPMIVVGALSSVGLQWCLREREYGPIASSAIVGSLANVAACLLLFALGWRDGALVAGYCFGAVVAAAYVWVPRVRVLHEILAARERRATFSRYRHFPAHVLPGSLATVAGSYLFPVLVTQLAGLHFAGLYAIANRVLALPAILVGNALQSVFHAEINARIAGGLDGGRLFDKTLLSVVAIAVPTFGVLWLVSPTLFRVAFGDAYAEAGEYARYILIGSAATFVSAPILPVFIAVGRTGSGLCLQVAGSFVPLFAFVVVQLRSGFADALLAASCTTVVASLATVLWARHVMRAAPAASVRA